MKGVPVVLWFTEQLNFQDIYHSNKKVGEITALLTVQNKQLVFEVPFVKNWGVTSSFIDLRKTSSKGLPH